MSQLRSRLLGALGMLILAGCTTAPQPVPPKASPTRSPSVVLPATPSPSSAPAALVVEKVGASASPNGFLAFALVSNPSSQPAAEVKVDVMSIGPSGQVLARGSGTIRQIDPMHKQAIAVRVALTQTLPASFNGIVSGNRWLDASAAAEVTDVMSAVFVQDPRTPSVRVRMANRATQPEEAAITAICFDAGGDLRGGGTASMQLPASATAQDVWVAVSIPVVPASCEAYSLTQH